MLLQGQVLNHLSRLRSAANSGAADLAAALAVGGLPCLLVQPSTLRGAGRGLFLAPGSSVPAGSVITFYPGGFQRGVGWQQSTGHMGAAVGAATH